MFLPKDWCREPVLFKSKDDLFWDIIGFLGNFVRLFLHTKQHFIRTRVSVSQPIKKVFHKKRGRLFVVVGAVSYCKKGSKFDSLPDLSRGNFQSQIQTGSHSDTTELEKNSLMMASFAGHVKVRRSDSSTHNNDKIVLRHFRAQF